MSPEGTPSVKKLETHQLGPLLAKPEPMWVGLVSLQTGATSAPALISVAPEIERRLRGNLREYDDLYQLPNGLFVLVLRTLAEASALQPRLQRVFDSVALPYVVDQQRFQYRVVLGAAIRRPEEDVDALLNRVAEALKQADSDGLSAPVLLGS